MTVADLIALLETVEDKSLPIVGICIYSNTSFNFAKPIARRVTTEYDQSGSLNCLDEGTPVVTLELNYESP